MKAIEIQNVKNRSASGSILTLSLIVRLFAVVFLFCGIQGTAGLFAQSSNLVNGNAGAPAGFGMEGDAYSGILSFGSLSGGASSDDWFYGSGSGTGLINPANGQAFVNANLNASFSLSTAFPFFERVNGKILIDAVYVRDNFGGSQSNDSSMFKGSNKSAENPMTEWQLGSGNVQGKSDIIDFYAHVRRDGTTFQDDLWLYTALGFAKVSGTAYADVELFQEEITYDKASGSLSNTGSDEGHTAWLFDASGNVLQAGDMIMSYNHDGSGISSLEVRIWVHQNVYNNTNPQTFQFDNDFAIRSGHAYGYARISPNQSNVYFGNSNPANIPAPVWGTRDDHGNVSVNYINNQFGEFGINLTALGIDPQHLPGLDPCDAAFKSVIAKTRASQSFSAALKDFVGPVPFSFAGPELSVQASRNLVPFCPVTASVQLEVENPVRNAIYTWYTADGQIAGNHVDTVITATQTGTYVVAVSYSPFCNADDLDTVFVMIDTDCDNVVDFIDIDDDNDGITDTQESCGSQSFACLNGDPAGDDDQDGILNYKDSDFCTLNAHGVCQLLDADNDGIINSLDLDADNDQIPDLVEAAGVDTNGDGVIDSNIDVDADGLMDVYDMDRSGYSIRAQDTDSDGLADYLDLDSDNDGIADLTEAGGIDTDRNGIADNFTDIDLDGYHDLTDGDVGNDGQAENAASALQLTGVDEDNDGVPNSYPEGDFDLDGFVDQWDNDSDNDGISDVVEAGGLDANGDGIIDNFTDSGNGLADQVDPSVGNSALELPDSDFSGNPDYIDNDSDDDGCFDTYEAGVADEDNDGFLGYGAVSVHGNGMVIHAAGYSLPIATVAGRFDFRNAGLSNACKPDANDDQDNTMEDQPVSNSVINNDSDPNNDIMTVTSTPVMAPGFGTLQLEANGDFTYYPAREFYGQDVFRYEICDNGTPVRCDTAWVTIWVSPVNDRPEAKNDINNTLIDQPVEGNVATNDVDMDNDILTVNTTPVLSPASGMLSLASDGSYVYIPDAGFTGQDRFIYEICDNPTNGTLSECDSALVEIVVSSISYPNPPVANADFFKTTEGSPIDGNVALNDFDPDEEALNVNTTPVRNTAHGSLSLNPDGTFTYTPGTDFTGTDAFVYEICDSGNPVLCATAEAVIQVDPAREIAGNDPPVADDDAYMTRQDHAVNGNVLDNDYDINGDQLILKTIPVSDPAFGSVSVNGDGTFVYSPSAGYHGPDRFVYEICDNATPQYCRRATVYITVFPAELFPVEFVEFKAIMDGKDAKLNWATATEVNSDFFAIERSLDGVYFQEAGQVVAAGNATSIRTYDYTDANVTELGATVLFYRLRQVDIDGAFTYSDVVELIPGGENGISMKAYPNPATDVLNVSLTLAQNDGAMDLRMVDQTGRTVMQKSLSASQGFQNHTLNVSSLASGIYYLHAASENHISTQKIVIK